MKRKRKTRNTFTLTQKRGLINKVITLLNQGVKLTHARIEVARKNNTTPISLARWAKDMTVTSDYAKSIPKSNGKILTSVKGSQLVRIDSPISKVHVTGVNLHIPGTGNLTLDSTTLEYISKLAGFTK